MRGPEGKLFRNESNEDRRKEENLTSTTGSDERDCSSLTGFPPSAACMGLRAETPCCLRFLWDPSVGSPSRGSPPIPPIVDTWCRLRKTSPFPSHQRFRERGRSSLMNEARVINRLFFHPLFRTPPPPDPISRRIFARSCFNRPRALRTIYPSLSPPQPPPPPFCRRYSK